MARIVLIIVVTLIAGAITGYIVARKTPSGNVPDNPSPPADQPKSLVEPAPSPIDRESQIQGQAPERTDAPDMTMKETLAEFESVMDQFFRQDPVAELQASVSRLVENHNQWVTQRKEEFETQRGKHEKQVAIVRALEADIEKLDEQLSKSKPDAADREAVTAYNSLVSHRNELGTKHRELAEVCQKNQTALNEAVDRVNQETAKRAKQIETAKHDAKAQLEVYRQWRESKQDEAFWKRLNQFYAELYQESRGGVQSRELDQSLAKVRAMREELGQRFAQQQADKKEGLIVVRATLCGTEECFYIVDTGATLLTISSSFVERLDLSDRVGDEIEVSLAGNIRIKAPQIVIPQVSVLGKSANDIKGVVLDEPDLGADGLLGMSFLSRFDYHIDVQHPDKLILKPRPDERAIVRTRH